MLGKRLKKLRTDKKMTQEELGKVINVTKVSISGYENGNRMPDTDTLTSIANYFEVSTDFLLGRSDSPEIKSDEEFEQFVNSPDLQTWYKELPENDEEELRQLKEIWEIIKKKENEK